MERQKPDSVNSYDRASLSDLNLGYGEAHARWQRESLFYLERIERCRELISDRDIRASVARVVSVIQDIRRNCQLDPQDINEEVGFATIVRRVAETLEDLVPIVAEPNRPPEVARRIAEVSQFLIHSEKQFQEILTCMLGNDGEDMTLRAQLISRVLSVTPSKSKR